IRAGIREASILIIAIPHETTAVEATALARRLNPSLHIVTRCHYVSKGMEARSQGANQVVVAEQVVAMELAEVVRTLLESPIAIEPKEDSSHG
ncbi:MAG: NAD-binding protein, partial [Tepidisphaeraceae bacterium]